MINYTKLSPEEESCIYDIVMGITNDNVFSIMSCISLEIAECAIDDLLSGEAYYVSGT